MNQATAIRKRLWWRVQEIKLYRAWKSTTKKYPKHSPIRQKAYDDWVHARYKRRQYDTIISKFDIIHVDRHGEDEIVEREGAIPYAYEDSRGFATAWVGHLIRQGPLIAADYKKWGSRANPAPMDKVLAFFLKDLAPYEKAVAQVWAEAIKNGHRKPKQEEFNACVSFVFNIGIGGWLSSRAANLIRGGNYRLVPHAMLMWDEPPEIMGRRRSEANEFRNA